MIIAHQWLLLITFYLLVQESTELTWSIEDSSSISSIELMVSYDTIGSIYPLASLEGEASSYTYFAPESIVTSYGRLIMNVTDANDNSSTDTSGFFEIYDIIAPDISISLPDQISQRWSMCHLL